MRDKYAKEQNHVLCKYEFDECTEKQNTPMKIFQQPYSKLHDTQGKHF